MVKIEAALHPEEAELVWTMLNHCAAQVMNEHAATADSRPAAVADSRPVATSRPATDTRSPSNDTAAQADTAKPRQDEDASSVVGDKDGSAESSDSRHAAISRRSNDTGLSSSNTAAQADTAKPLQDEDASQVVGKKDDSAESSPSVQRADTRVPPQVSAAISSGLPTCDDELGPMEHSRRASSTPLNSTTTECSPLLPADTRSVRAPSVLQRQVDATRRAFDRADALLLVAQQYLRGDKPNR